MKSTIFASAALAAATIGLAACGDDPAPAEAADAKAMPGITVTDGRLVLPAVAGNPGAIYFTVHNDGESDAAIRSASVTGAQSASLHNTTDVDGQPTMGETLQVDVPQGGEATFEPGGFHVMAMGLDESLAAGGTTEVTLHFTNGKKANFPVTIAAAGDER